MIDMIIKLLVIFMVMISPISASASSSEWITCNGAFSSWHDGVDGVIKDRSLAHGNIEYQAELYEGGLSSGFTVLNGSGSYAFASRSYTVKLDEFEGTIVSEADDMGAVVKGSGKGHLILNLYGNSKTSVRPFPIGEINANGFFKVDSKTFSESGFTEVDMNESDSTTELLRSLI
jgi:hypothetical protein